MLATSSTKDNSVPGNRQTATLVSSGAAKPREPVPKLRVISLSPIFADRDWTGQRSKPILNHLVGAHGI
jgi:hypothetical protein